MNSVSEITKLVEEQAGGNITEDFVWLALDQLSENNLLEREVAVSFNGRSRREAIKKIGMASMVAVPIIASLVAPRSAMAAVSCACNNPMQCGNPSNSNCLSRVNCNAGGICAP
jgi:hypothetical protein